MSRYSRTVQPDAGRPIDFSPIGDALSAYGRRREERKARETEAAHRASREQIGDERYAAEQTYRQGRDVVADGRATAEDARRDRDEEIRVAQGGIVPASA